MADIHAHEVLHMMEGYDYASKESLKQAITAKFGAEQTFRSCSVKGLAVDALVDFLESKGKFKPSSQGFTMDITKVCDGYKKSYGTASKNLKAAL
ncbi:MAG: YecH family metal-binding protein [Rikenellaceae bacterium]